MSTRTLSMKRGEGSIREQSNGKLNYRKTITLPNGERKDLSVTGSSLSDCLSRMSIKENAISKNIQKTKNLPLADSMEAWLENFKKPMLAPQSYTRLKSTIEHHIRPSAIGHIRYHAITADDIQALINKLNTEDHLSESSIKKVYLALNAYYKHTSMAEKIDNPMCLVQMPAKQNIIKPTKNIAYLSKEDTIKFVKVSVSKWATGKLIYRYGPVLAANLFLGLRISELLALHWADVDLENNIITVNKTMVEIDNPEYKDNVPELMKDMKISKKIHIIQNYTKTKQTRYVPINETAKTLLMFYKDYLGDCNPDDFIMYSCHEKPTDISGVAKTMVLIQKRAGIQNTVKNTHSLRHTCASFYFSEGIPIEIICSILGNSREVCEDTYVHIIEENKMKAAEKITLPGISI